ncbi:dna mismatch repair protein msh5 [Nicotiana attenuata]|uniref:Dna mismatch repair protein msh5 n=2 Tax=Nicotiana attenuata TaxID=49451 RepID=A0A314KTJ5_NICAT|nr:dna mismatch repair protein msh5 [Nicotiana attenuata]
MSVLSPDKDCADVEDIVFLYRLVPGRALLSYGLHCGQLAGLPHEVLKRAALILDTLKNDNQIERLSRDNVIARDQQYKDAVEKFLAFDARKGDLLQFFEGVFSTQS